MLTLLGEIRVVLDEFCADHSVDIDSPLAMDAAKVLMGLTEQDLDLPQIRNELESWSQTRATADDEAAAADCATAQ